MNRQPLSVTNLNLYIKTLMESDEVLNNIIVKGEISNFKHHSSGHMYFTLKDDNSKIRCIMFRGSNLFLKFVPEDGMNVVIEGHVSLYERDGQYQLYCSRMEPDGLGSLYLAYEQLKERLQKEGLFGNEFKKPIPEFPKKIGVATSPTGAVIRDIINVSTNRFPGINILLYPVKVQGEGASRSIVSAIEYFNSRDDIDVIIVGRGGGSIEELWAFNEEDVVRVIFKSRIPVISAVGHETDFTIADFVADARASTPSHAAEIAVPSYNDITYKIDKLRQMLITHTSNGIYQKSFSVRNYLQHMKANSPKNRINQYMQYLDNLQNKLGHNIKITVSTGRTSVSVCSGKLDSLSPLKVLARGYTYVEKNNIVVRSVSDIKRDELIRMHMNDGMVDCKVIDIMEGQRWQQEKKN